MITHHGPSGEESQKREQGSLTACLYKYTATEVVAFGSDPPTQKNHCLCAKSDHRTLLYDLCYHGVITRFLTTNNKNTIVLTRTIEHSSFEHY